MEEEVSNNISKFVMVEICFGVLGTLLFIFIALIYLSRSLGPYLDIITVAHIEIILLPYLLLMISAKGILKFKLWAWHMNVYIVPLIFTGINVSYFLILINPTKMQDWHPFVYFMLSAFIFLIAQAVFYMRPSIKTKFDQ